MLTIGFGILTLGLLALIALPVIMALALVFLVLKLVFALVLLPIRVALWGIGGAFTFAGFVLKVVLGTILMGLVAVVVLGVVLVPLLPVLLLVGLGWLIYRLVRPARAVVAP